MQRWERSRPLAAAALVLAGLTMLVLLDGVASHFGSLLLAAVGGTAGAFGGWWATTERWPRRGYGIGLVLVGVMLVGEAFSTIAADGHLLLVLALALSAAVCARLAVAHTLHAIDLEGSLPKYRPRQAVLLCNPTSGGGKVAQFDIPDRARALGVEVVELRPGDDLESLARQAVRRGADCLGMAGGDGSQALVAAVAAAYDLPFVCISAGTRNHFAADLGLNRNHPEAGLEAFRGGVLRRVDYGLVNGRLFVNNVSLGIYASVVEQSGYRDAKVATLLETLPSVIGPEAEPYDLHFTMKRGVEVSGAFLVLVSNNPYVMRPGPDMAQRRSLTSGALGVVAVTGDRTMSVLSAPAFRLDSGQGSVQAGVDGESVALVPPLEFRIVPRGLRVLVPTDTLAVTAGRRYRNFGVRGLWDIARGRPPRIDEVLP